MGRVRRIISAAGLVGMGALLGYLARPSTRIRPKIAIDAADDSVLGLEDAVLDTCPQAALVEGASEDYTIYLFWGIDGTDGWVSFTKRKDGVVVTPLLAPSYIDRDYKRVLRRICHAIINDTSHWAGDVAQQQNPGLALHTADSVPEPIQSGGSDPQPIAPKHKKPNWFDLNKPK